jgi:hypothetical protein
MGGIFGGGGGDNSAMLAQLEQQRQETERMRAQADAERRDLLEKQQASVTARRRAGARGLLSDARLNPESGVGEETLGANSGVV